MLFYWQETWEANNKHFWLLVSDKTDVHGHRIKMIHLHFSVRSSSSGGSMSTDVNVFPSKEGSW